MYKLDTKRVATMRKRLGDASALIKDDNYLPFFRSRQIKYPNEFKESVEQAKRKHNPSHWLASIWAGSKIAATVKMLKGYINRKIVALAEKREANRLETLKRNSCKNTTAAQRAENLLKLKAMYKTFMHTC